MAKSGGGAVATNYSSNDLQCFLKKWIQIQAHNRLIRPRGQAGSISHGIVSHVSQVDKSDTSSGVYILVRNDCMSVGEKPSPRCAMSVALIGTSVYMMDSCKEKSCLAEYLKNEHGSHRLTDKVWVSVVYW